MKKAVWLLSLFVLTVSAAECDPKFTPKLFHRFADNVTTPDGMALDASGNLYISGANFNNKLYPGVIYKFKGAKGDKAELWFSLPAHPETGYAAPMGMGWGADGCLYYADNQFFNNPNSKSRVMRIRVNEKGEPLGAEPVIENLKFANTIRCDDKYVYVSDTTFDLSDSLFSAGKKTRLSGVYRVPYEAFKNAPVKLGSKKDAEFDPYCIAVSEMFPKRKGDEFGVNGVALDKNGTLYYGHFGDGQFFRVTFDKDGKPNKPELLDDKSTDCIDGICYYAKKDWIIITDSAANAIRYWDIKAGKMGLLWENGDTNGADGLLDQPSDSIVVNGKLIVANFDMPLPGMKNTAWDNVNTMSVIDLHEGCPFLRWLGF